MHIKPIETVHYLAATTDPIFAALVNESAHDWIARIEKNINLLIIGSAASPDPLDQVGVDAFHTMLKNLGANNHD